jgi:ribosomal protein S18 acetylase RimI-like enzyme
MNFPNDKFELVLAQHSAWSEIKEIYESGEFDGGIAVQYLRDPDPIASFEREGEKAVILMLRDKQANKAVGFGACMIKRVYNDNKIVNMGYLTGLKLLPEYRGKVLLIPYVYEKLYEYTKDYVDFYFTTILKENTAVQKMLEKPRKLMPLYEYLGNYRVYFCKAGISGFGYKENSLRGNLLRENLF